MSAQTDLTAALLEHGIRHKALRLTPGASSSIPCPHATGKCHAHDPSAPSLSVTIDTDGNGAVWNCKRGSCGGMTGSLSLKSGPTGFRKREVKTYRRPTPPPDAKPTDEMLAWFTKRGISAAVVRRNGIYRSEHWFFPVKGEPETGLKKPCIVFPFYRDGVLINNKYRSPDKRFMQDKDAEKVFFGLDDIKGHDWCVIVEGEVDKLSFEEAGIVNCLSVPDGAPELVREVWHCEKCGSEYRKRSKDGDVMLCCDQPMEVRPAPIDPDDDKKYDYVWNCLDELKSMKRIILAVDSDKAGRALEEELSRRLGRDRCFRLRWPTYEGAEDAGEIQIKDANECLLAFGAETIRQCFDDAKPYPIEDVFSAGDYFEEVMKIHRGEIAQGYSTGFEFLDQHFQFRFNGTLILVTGIPAHGKALALDTPVPTPSGWTTMGEIKVGDTVYDENGEPCTVTAATEVMHDRPCHLVRFDDGTEIVADAEHLWKTISEPARRSALQQAKKRQGREETKPRGTDQRHKITHPSVVTTKHISETLWSYGKRNHHVALCGAVQGQHVDLPIKPYTMGCWLGDGRTMFGGIVTYDQEIRDGIAADGYTLSKQAQEYHHTIRGGVHRNLRLIGALGNKHIPEVYLRASVEQRLQLLQGLMDTDGTCMKDRRCEFTTINPVLAKDFLELVCSLGIKATMITGRATLNGVDCGEKYRICFTTDVPVFTIARKLERQGVGKPSRTANWIIMSCDPVPSVPVRCIQVNSPSHLFLVSRSFIPTHNSEIWDQFVINIARLHQVKTAYCSFENDPPEHLTKLLEKQLRMPFEQKYYDGARRAMGEGDVKRGMDWLSKYLFFMSTEENSPTVDWIIDRAKAAVVRYGIKLLIVDPWNRIEHQKPKDVSEGIYIASVLDRLQRAGKAHGFDVVVVAHPTKLKKDDDGVEPVPTPYDISGTAHFFNMASVCMTVWRDRQNTSMPVQLHIQKMKHKRQGREGVIEFKWDNTDGHYDEVPHQVLSAS